MSYKISFTKKADEDLEYHARNGDKSVRSKISALMRELAEHPDTGTGQVERLRHQYSGYWSRRINREHRIIYSIDEDAGVVTIYSMKDHYK